MPDAPPMPTHVSLRVPSEVVTAFDKLAAALDRPCSWVMLRALRQYLKDEGAEIFEDLESIAELDRGESVSSEALHEKLQGSSPEPECSPRLKNEPARQLFRARSSRSPKYPGLSGRA